MAGPMRCNTPATRQALTVANTPAAMSVAPIARGEPASFTVLGPAGSPEISRCARAATYPAMATTAVLKTRLTGGNRVTRRCAKALIGK